MRGQNTLLYAMPQIVDFAFTNISKGVDKSLDLAKHWIDVVLGKVDLLTAVDKSFDLAKHWVHFGINFVKHVFDDVATFANVKVKAINKKEL